MPFYTDPERYGGICECGNHAWCRLTKGHVSLVSVQDADLIKNNNWCAKRKGNYWYAIRSIRQYQQIYLHLQILPAEKDSFVDHGNRCGTDNRRENLRRATRAQNYANRHSPPVGASFVNGRWRAIIQIDGKRFYLGHRFETRAEATAAYNKVARDHYGEFFHEKAC